MKQTLFIIASLLMFAACTADETPVFRLDPEAMISIKPDASAFPSNTMLRSGIVENPAHLSALEIVKQTSIMEYRNDAVFHGVGGRGFSDAQVDTSATNPCLKMWGTDIIDADGNYYPNFIEGYDVMLIKFLRGDPRNGRDTIGYIPKSVLRAAEDSIKKAYSESDIEAVYRVFNDAFTFRPITGAEWLELKSQGLN